MYWKIESLGLNLETFCVHTTLNLGLQDPNWFWLLLCHEHKESAKRTKIQESHPWKRFTWEGNSSHLWRHQQRSEDHSWSSLQPSLLWHAGNGVQFLFGFLGTSWRLSHVEKEKFKDPARPRTLHWSIWVYNNSKRHQITFSWAKTMLFSWQRLPSLEPLFSLHSRKL